MNSKLLYAATIAISLIGTLAMADEAPAATGLTRAQVNAELHQAIADGTLQRSDYDVGSYRADPRSVSTKTRAEVGVELAEAKSARKPLTGPNANRTYNPYGTEILQASTLSRADVKAEVREAAANGTLQRTDYDYDAPIARRANGHTASATLAQRLKAALARLQS